MNVKIDGTENHCGSCADRINSVGVTAAILSSGGTGWSSAPAAIAPKRSKTDRSKCSGGCPEILSEALIPKYAIAQSTKWATFEWVMTTPFGSPVDPEVNRR